MTDNTVVQIQRFTASSISMLNLLRTACMRMDDNTGEKFIRGRDRFMSVSQAFINGLKNTETQFDYTKTIKKSFSVLKSDSNCDLLLAKDKKLFELRDEEGKITTIIPGLDIKIGYNLLKEEEIVVFWQYIYLFACSVFRMIENANDKTSFQTKYSHVLDTLAKLEEDIAKTGVMFNNQIFNPFIGVGENNSNYSVDEMFTGGALPNEQKLSMDSILSTLGIDKLLDEDKIKEQLENFDEEQTNEATDQIMKLLGVTDNPDIREVCGILISDIVAGLKQDGVSKIGDTLMNVTQKAKEKIDHRKMQQTAGQMHHFMTNSKETMKNMTDADGNPIGQQLMDNMAIPLSMMSMFGMGGAMPNSDSNPKKA